MRYILARKALTFSLILFLLFASLLKTAGQEGQREAPPFKDRLFYGGSFGLQFGTFTDISVSPVIGVWILPRVNIAVGPNFRYYKVPGFHTMIYGGKIYTELVFIEDLNNMIPLGLHLGFFLHAEDEALSLESAAFKSPPFDSGRFLLNSILAGGGIRQQMGMRSSLNLTFLWALNDSGYGIYSNPEIRVSFIF